MVTVIYNGFGHRKERRSHALSPGENIIDIEGVPERIDSESVWISGGDFDVKETTFNYDTIDIHSILEKYVGEEVQVYDDVGANAQSVYGKLLKVEGKDMVIETSNGIEIMNAKNVKLPSLPDGMKTKPTITVKADSDTAKNTGFDVNYLTSGLDWDASYVMEVDGEDVSIKGSAVIRNTTGADITNDDVSLVAGDVRKVSGRGGYKRHMKMAKVADQFMDAAEIGGEPNFEVSGLEDFHLYKLKDKVSVKNNENKKFGFLEEDVKSNKRYVLDPGMYGDKVEVLYDIENKQDNGLGVPLPRGLIRLYSKEEGMFLGEDSLNHTAKDETLHVRGGKAFDVVSKKTVRTTSNHRDFSDNLYKVELKNHKDEDIEVEVVDRFGGKWDIIDESLTHADDDGQIKWKVSVPANSETTLEYKVRNTYRR